MVLPILLLEILYEEKMIVDETFQDLVMFKYIMEKLTLIYFCNNIDINILKEANKYAFLEINKDSLVKKLKSIGAIEVGDWFQIRKTFDLIIPQQNSWLRLRTNGETTTLTVKEINSAKIDGTKEAEVVVDDFDEMDTILTKIGLKSNKYQENKRIQ